MGIPKTFRVRVISSLMAMRTLMCTVNSTTKNRMMHPMTIRAGI